MRDARLAPSATARTLAVLFCAPLLALTGCGGGGGDGDGTPAGDPVQSSLVISAANARPVAADALDSATNVEAARTSSSFVLSAQVVPTTAATSPALRVAQVVTALTHKRANASSPHVLSAAVNETLACSLGGTLTVSGSVASNSGFAAGDSVTLGANNCRETIGNVATNLSGSFSLAITAGGVSSGTGFPQHVAMTIQASNFTVSGGGASSIANGDMSLDVTENSADSTSVVLSGSSLSNQVTVGGTTRSFTMRAYRQVLAIAGTLTSYTVTADIETSNSRLGSAPVRYHVSTPAALVLSDAGEFSSGSLRVDGNASALLLTVTGSNAFQLQVDANGDGSFEASSTATLGELRAQP